jgi:membrane-associated phospholipid phosphatase
LHRARTPVYNIANMKKTFGGIKLYWFLIVMAVAILGVVFGSFFDWDLSKAIASTDNQFGKFFEAFGEALGYALVPIGATLVFMGLKDDRPLGLKILGWAVLILGIGIPTYILGNAATSEFAYGLKVYIAYPVAFVIMTLASMFTYFLAGFEDKSALIKVGLALLIAMVLQLLIINVFKIFAQRPRFRFIMDLQLNVGGDSQFHAWYQWGSGVKFSDMLKSSNDNFKSFPSGHSGTAAVCLLLPLLATTKKNPLFKGESLVLFLVGALYTIIVAFARILAGAHFLSDVSMAILIASLVDFLTIFVIYQPKKQAAPIAETAPSESVPSANNK